MMEKLAELKSKGNASKPNLSFARPPNVLATLIDAPFDSKDWVFETKWDGFRSGRGSASHPRKGGGSITTLRRDRPARWKEAQALQIGVAGCRHAGNSRYLMST
jgi:hypothetical protein